MRVPHRVRMNLEVTFEYEAEDMASLEREVRAYVKEHRTFALRMLVPDTILVTRIESRRRKEFEYGKSRATAKRS